MERNAKFFGVSQDNGPRDKITLIPQMYSTLIIFPSSYTILNADSGGHIAEKQHQNINCAFLCILLRSTVSPLLFQLVNVSHERLFMPIVRRLGPLPQTISALADRSCATNTRRYCCKLNPCRGQQERLVFRNQHKEAGFVGAALHHKQFGLVQMGFRPVFGENSSIGARSGVASPNHHCQ